MNQPAIRCPKGAALIPISNGEFTVVDDEDHADLSTLSWHRHKEGYVVHTFWDEDGSGRRRSITLLMHRLVLRAPSFVLVDHWNGDPLDNRKQNLRTATHQENAWNRGKSSGQALKGIYAFRNGWKARIKRDGQSIYLGLYTNPIHAALAYDEAARQLFGEFARLNFPER